MVHFRPAKSMAVLAHNGGELTAQILQQLENELSVTQTAGSSGPKVVLRLADWGGDLEAFKVDAMCAGLLNDLETSA